MKKDFDAWNEQKKKVDAQESGRLYRAREVWWCKLGINIGFEQDGTGAEHSRPVLVLKAFSAFACLIVPLSTSTKKNRYYVSVGSIDGKEARAIISQVRLVDTRRLENKICVLDKAMFGAIKKVVKDLL
jgi:mRNA interferase MazF